MHEVAELLDREHYIGSQCADPSFVFAWRLPGGLFGDTGEVLAAAVFAPPASYAWGRRAIELVRLVRAANLGYPLTQFIALCLKSLRQTRRYDFVIAYADPSVGHHGGVYQSGNWLYLRRSSRKVVYVAPNGRRQSQRSYDQRSRHSSGSSHWTAIKTTPKLTYIYPLTATSRRYWTARSKPYEKPSRSASGGVSAAS